MKSFSVKRAVLLQNGPVPKGKPLLRSFLRSGKASLLSSPSLASSLRSASGSRRRISRSWRSPKWTTSRSSLRHRGPDPAGEPASRSAPRDGTECRARAWPAGRSCRSSLSGLECTGGFKMCSRRKSNQWGSCWREM